MLKVVLIDDERPNLYLIKEILYLLNSSIECIAFESAVDAIAFLKNSDSSFPSLLLIDSHMPGIDGFEFAKFYQENFYAQNPNSIVAMISSSIEPSDKIRAMEFECIDDFCIKEDINGTLKQLLNKHFPKVKFNDISRKENN